jgi:hypothetical protein
MQFIRISTQRHLFRRVFAAICPLGKNNYLSRRRFLSESVKPLSKNQSKFTFTQKAFAGAGIASTGAMIYSGITYWQYIEQEKAKNLMNCYTNLSCIGEIRYKEFHHAMVTLKQY